MLTIVSLLVLFSFVHYIVCPSIYRLWLPFLVPLCFVIVPVFLDGPFLISPSGFSNVNIHSNVKGSICYLMTRLIFLDILCQYLRNHLGSVMVSVLASSSVDRGFDPRLGLTKDYTIGICCFSAMNTALRRKSKYRWLGIRIMCPSGTTCLCPRIVVFQWASTIKNLICFWHILARF